jgi:hypothetical protein
MEVSGQLHSPGWVGPRAGLDAVVKSKSPIPCRDSNPPIIQPVAQRYNHWDIPAPWNKKKNKFK